MPYIKKEIRENLESALDNLLQEIYVEEAKGAGLDGALNYVISTIVTDGINPTRKPWSYADIARATAVFECAKLEYYRRIAGPKEDLAIEQNGDIDAYVVHTSS